MFRAIPRPNRICSEKKIKEDLTLHRKKLKEMKAFIDIMRPDSYEFLKSRKKKNKFKKFGYVKLIGKIKF